MSGPTDPTTGRAAPRITRRQPPDLRAGRRRPVEPARPDLEQRPHVRELRELRELRQRPQLDVRIPPVVVDPNLTFPDGCPTWATSLSHRRSGSNPSTPSR